MALTERTRPYELLIRFHQNAAGQETIAAHQLQIYEILQDGEVISAKELAAEPLDPEMVAGLVGEQLPRLVAERDALAAGLASVTAEKQVAVTELDSVTAQHEAAVAELNALKATIAEAGV